MADLLMIAFLMTLLVGMLGRLIGEKAIKWIAFIAVVWLIVTYLNIR